MRIGDIHPVPPADVPNGSMFWWLVLALALAVVVAAGMFLASRR